MKFKDMTNKIICCDCLEGIKDIPDNSIDLVVTSPPYDNLRTYDGFADAFQFEPIARELFRIIKTGGVVVWVVGDATINGSETGTSFKQALYFKECGFKLHDTMIYSKGGFANPSNNRYHQTFEYMFIFSNGKPKTFNPIKDRKNIEIRMGGDSKRNKKGQIIKGKKTGLKLEKYGKRFNIWNYKIGGGHVATDCLAVNHPAVFPEKLAQDHIISWSNKNDIVLDIFAGSGTTAKMAIKQNRQFIGFEINQKYVDIANKRIKNEQEIGKFDFMK